MSRLLESTLELSSPKFETSGHLRGSALKPKKLNSPKCLRAEEPHDQHIGQRSLESLAQAWRDGQQRSMERGKTWEPRA